MRWFRLLALKFARPEIEASQALDQARQARAALEIANASLQRENEYLRQQFETAIAAERRALHMVANVGMQSKFGITPYPDAPGLPEEGANKPSEQMQPATMQGIDIVKNHRANAVKEYRERANRGEQLPMSVEQFEQYAGAL